MQLRNEMLCALAAADLKAITPFLREITLRPDEILSEAGDLVRRVYFPSSAVLSVFIIMTDGRAVASATVGYEGASGLTGAMSRLPAAGRTLAQVGGGAIEVDAQHLRRLAGASPTLRETIFRFVDLSARQTEQAVACNVLHPAGPRLARWLLVTQDRTGEPVLPMTQEYLAITLGVQRTTVTKVAAELKAAGLITYARGAIRIRDRAGLERAACECYVARRERWPEVQPHAIGGARSLASAWAPALRA